MKIFGNRNPGEDINQRLMAGTDRADRRGSTDSDNGTNGRLGNSATQTKCSVGRVLLAVFTLGASEGIRAYRASHSSGARGGGIHHPGNQSPVRLRGGNGEDLFGDVANNDIVTNGTERGRRNAGLD